MLYKSKDNKSLIITCDCGCTDGMEFLVDDELKDYNSYCFLELFNGNFYRDQISCWDIIKKKCKKIWAIIRNKDIYYSDIIMTKDDLVTLRDYLNQFIEEDN